MTLKETLDNHNLGDIVPVIEGMLVSCGPVKTTQYGPSVAVTLRDASGDFGFLVNNSKCVELEAHINQKVTMKSSKGKDDNVYGVSIKTFDNKKVFGISAKTQILFDQASTVEQTPVEREAAVAVVKEVTKAAVANGSLLTAQIYISNLLTYAEVLLENNIVPVDQLSIMLCNFGNGLQNGKILPLDVELSYKLVKIGDEETVADVQPEDTKAPEDTDI